MAAAKAVAVVVKAAGPEAAAVPVQVAAAAVLAQVAAVVVPVAVAVPALAGADHITMKKRPPQIALRGSFLSRPRRAAKGRQITGSEPG